jgi:antitoxin VapB
VDAKSLREAARVLGCRGRLFDLVGVGAVLHINVNNPQADALTRKFARLEGVGITEAIVIAMREAIQRRRSVETPRETAARLRVKHGVTLGEAAKAPLPKEAFDEMWGKP